MAKRKKQLKRSQAKHKSMTPASGHDGKEIWGTEQQQVSNIRSNLGCGQPS